MLSGGTGDDRLYGNAGNDTIWGDQGADQLYGEDGSDSLIGGEDDDLLVGGSGTDNLQGNQGADTLWGEGENDLLNGGDGNDVLRGGSGHDVLTGGANDDVLLGNAGNDTLWGDAGNDQLYGETDHDTLYGGDDDDLLVGGPGTDHLLGNLGNDTLWGEDGNDTLSGLDGNDYLNGGAGHDVLTGGDGNDVLFGNTGNDTLWGETGNDQLHGEGDHDEVHGGDGNDLLTGGNGNDELAGDLGDDTLWGDAGADLLYGDAGIDVLRGGGGGDVLTAGTGDDELYGDGGNDQLLGEIGNDRLEGGSGNDSLEGGAGDDLLFGGDGDDQLHGGSNNDLLRGGTGLDDLKGSHGTDVLIGGDDFDLIDGENDDDLLIAGISSLSDAELEIILGIWSGAASYEDRILAIEDDSSAVYLKSNDTVFDDYVSEVVVGGGGRDWFFLPGILATYDAAGTGGSHGGGGSGHHHSSPLIDHLPVVEGFELIDSLDNLDDRKSDEAMHTLIPHAGDPLRQKEHLALFELVRYDEVTHTALISGDWSNPAIWENSNVPTDGSRVLIPFGVEVTVDQVLDESPFSVRVDGTLSFATTVDTELRVDTIIGSATSVIQLGTSTTPVAANATAKITFTDDGPIDRDYDPFGISRGLITHGSIEVYGAAKLSHSEAVGIVNAGQNAVQLSAIPAGWNVGDEIVIAGTSSTQNQDETRTISSIVGNIVFFSTPLSYDHLAPAAGLNVHVANITRNVVLESVASDPARRGHTMFMHNRNVDINYAAFNQLGRTDKSIPINDSVVDAQWQLVSGTGTNSRARYSLHFHRNGTLIDGNPSLVHGTVVNDGAGWGFVNHSSHVNFTENISFNVNGAGFVSEVGDETGSFENNIALATSGSGESVDSRHENQDFGHDGSGFWFQGGGVSVRNNVSAGSLSNAYTFYTQGLIESPGGARTPFLTANLPDPSIAFGEESLPVDEVPISDFNGNMGYGSHSGLTIRFHLRNAVHTQKSLLADSTFWNNEVGVDVSYSEQTTLRNLTIVRELEGVDSSTGAESNSKTKDIDYENLTISGYYHGIRAPLAGISVIDGGSFTTRSAILVRPAVEAASQVIIQGPIVFNALPPHLATIPQYEIHMQFLTTLENGSIDHLFEDSTVLLNYGSYANQELFFLEQAAGAIPFPGPGPGIPAGYVGLTTQQLFSTYGLSVGGSLAPVGAATDPAIIGLIEP